LQHLRHKYVEQFLLCPFPFYPPSHLPHIQISGSLHIQSPNSHHCIISYHIKASRNKTSVKLYSIPPRERSNSIQPQPSVWVNFIPRIYQQLLNPRSLFPKMTPNLCLCAMKLARPRTWFQPEVVESVNHLHYQSEPVPGVYLIRRDGRYLVAMKPRGTRQDAKIFKRHITLNEHEAEVYMEEGDISCTSCKLLLCIRGC
jgi:hypothetical protein